MVACLRNLFLLSNLPFFASDWVRMACSIVSRVRSSPETALDLPRLR